LRRYGGLDDKDLVDTNRWKTIPPLTPAQLFESR
jgi:hypothetical protein